MSGSLLRGISTASVATTRRVVVTGMGLVTCLGVGTEHVWQRLVAGECGITKSKLEDPKIPSQVCGYVPRGDKAWELNFDGVISKSNLRNMSNGVTFAVVAADEALTQANWKPEKDEDKERTGVSIGMCMNEPGIIVEIGINLKEKGYRSINPHAIPTMLSNMASGWVSLQYEFQGPNHAVATACSTGVHSIGDAYRMIQREDANVMVTGSTEAIIGNLTMAGFSRAKALSTNFNDEPEKASRPFDKKRDGFVMSEGAGVLVLEELHHALNRGANIYGEILGYGLSGDGYHLTAPRGDGKGSYNCMKAALRGIDPSEVGYVNAHATSTPLGDIAECKGIQRVFGSHVKNVAVSSSKGAVGHILAGAGSVEAIFTLLACQTGVIPPTINLTDPDPDCGDFNFVPNKSQTWPSMFKQRIGLTNSFGFGGTNASLCVGQFVP